ncbi:oligopeptide/dipeptide ABC transporter ATP-binding protein [Mesorhizobium sp. 8]|uniref:oligopeptide/dipeptide ABC transporter ATP-binding protein n=1 Tax=Mesorhizobium sp. 8 TaxID=2584466 RepID=UPI00111EEA79|nr:oligopeptide/dipeptide ABC transporter ATP-binding protein [Mesorhizobium sp. 8]QDC02211.1 ATP-binding cassette domain-containing protein [Mesorhizobium sp. 8]
MSFVAVREVERSYVLHPGSPFRQPAVLKALRGIKLDIAEGEILGLVGESGCGKSTLARLLLGIEQPSAGEVSIGGRAISAFSPRERARLIQPIFQDPYSSLNPRATVSAAIAAPLEIRNWGDARSRAAAVARMMDAVGLPRYLVHAYPMQLSGGQRQRVAIARALIGEPRILICDEPTSALDVSVQSQILNLLIELHKTFKLTMVLISHNLAVVSHLADRVAVMYLGRIVEIGETDAVFNRPRHPYTRELLRAMLLPGHGKGLPELNLKADFPSPVSPPSGCSFHPRCAFASDICAARTPLLTPVDGREAACHHPPA